MRRRLIWAGVAAVLGCAAAWAQTPTCDALPAAGRELAARLLASEYLYECCDDTISECLGRRPTCALAWRLAENVCRRVAAGQDERRIRRGLSRRARSMMGGGSLAVFDSPEAMTLGSPEAPVTVTVYACARCPYCSKLVPALVHEIDDGSLRREARLIFRVFPIRGHEGSTEAGLAFVAAAQLGAFWDYMLRAYTEFDHFDATATRRWASEVGLHPARFEALCDAPETREKLIDSKKEGLRNGVEETPTLCLNGRRWVGDLETEELLDAIHEETARVRGVTWVE